MSRKVLQVIGLAVMMGVLPAFAYAAEYKIDSNHSGVNFKIRHLVSKVSGKFQTFDGTFDFDSKNPKSWKTSVTIHADSIDTGTKKRDDHLRSDDFFDVKKYPTITFKSTKVTNVTKTSAKVHGDLTMHGVTMPVVLDVQIGGEAKDPWGNTRAGFTATTKVNRQDFGLKWNKALEAGGFLVGDDVEISLEVEGQKI